MNEIEELQVRLREHKRIHEQNQWAEIEERLRQQEELKKKHAEMEKLRKLLELNK